MELQSLFRRESAVGSFLQESMDQYSFNLQTINGVSFVPKLGPKVVMRVYPIQLQLSAQNGGVGKQKKNLLLGVGDGGRGVRYRTSFPPNKIAQVQVEWNSGHFHDVSCSFA